MQWRSRQSVLTSAVSDWAARGLLSEKDAVLLNEDIEQSGTHRSFQALLIVFGVLCIGLAALSMVAANWQDIPRPVRFLMVIAMILTSWAGAAQADRKGANIWYEGLCFLSCMLFGAGIMLVSQMYHIQGDPKDAVWLWALGSLVASALVRSGFSLALTMALHMTWFMMSIEDHFTQINMVYLGWWAIAAGLAVAFQSRFSIHVAALTFATWVWVCLVQTELDSVATLLTIGLLLLVVAIVLYRFDCTIWIVGIERILLVYTLLLLSSIVLMTHFSSTVSYGVGRPSPLMTKEPQIFLLPLASLLVALLGYRAHLSARYDMLVSGLGSLAAILILAFYPNSWTTACIAMALFIWVARMGWRLDMGSLRILGITGFAILLILVYAQTLGSLMGNAAFYFGTGLIILLAAYLGPKLFRKQG